LVNHQPIRLVPSVEDQSEVQDPFDKVMNEMKKCLKSTLNLNYYACALHGILNMNSYAYYLINLLDSKVTSNLQVTSSIHYIN
jgi:hypothetical protein